MLPAAADPLGARIDTEIVQQLQCWQRGDPGLAVVLVPLVEAPPGKACASRPLAVFALQGEQPVQYVHATEDAFLPDDGGLTRTARDVHLSI